MKKLIVPIILGLVMFGLAFGGAYYFQHYRQGAAEREIRSASAEALTALQKQGQITPYVARFAAVVPENDGEQGGEAAPGRLAVVPGTVRYTIDPKSIAQKDVVWNEEEKTVVVRLPVPAISAPELDGDDIRLYLPNGVLAGAGNARYILTEHNRVTAKVSVIEQAKGKRAMQAAREAIRKIVKRAFDIALRAGGAKAKLQVQFVDETPKPGEDHSAD